MGNAASSDLEALRAALDALNHVSIAIKLISEHLASLQHQSMMIELKFSSDGTFKAAFYRSDKERQPLTDDHLVIIRSDCEYLPKYVDSLWEAWGKADSAIANLPRRLVDRLEALTKTPWVSAVRRDCLDNILKWPGEPHHQTSYAAVKVFGTVEELLENARNADPFPTWQEYQRLLEEYTHDLYAIRDAIAPERPQTIPSAENKTGLPRAKQVNSDTQKQRPCKNRDALWLQWQEEIGADSQNVFGKIRDRWNAMPDVERRNYDPCSARIGKGKPGYDIVRKAIAAANNDGGKD
jgi:hypothetical protein